MTTTNKDKNTTTENSNADKQALTEKENEVKNLQSQIDKLEGMLQGFMNASNNQPQFIDTTSKMDKPCTIVHLLECPPGLPTVIHVNGIPQYFTRFGETRTFRFSEIQNIVSKYRDWFERGIFTFGEDIADKQDELGIHVVANQIPVSTYNKIEKLSNDDFESLIKKISDVQRINFVRTWMQRYEAKKPGYDNLDKIRILNKYTKDKTLFKNGILNNLLKDVVDEE